MSASDKKEMKALLKAAEEQGWTVRFTGSGHYQWKAPDGQTIIVTPSTPSDHRSMSNTRAQLKRAGLNLPKAR